MSPVEKILAKTPCSLSGPSTLQLLDARHVSYPIWTWPIMVQNLRLVVASSIHVEVSETTELPQKIIDFGIFPWILPWNFIPSGDTPSSMKRSSCCSALFSSWSKLPQPEIQMLLGVICSPLIVMTMINDDKLHKMGYNPCNYGYYGYLIHLLQQVAGVCWPSYIQMG